MVGIFDSGISFFKLDNLGVFDYCIHCWRAAFLRMAKGELKVKQPGMMTLISMLLAVAFSYSLASTIYNLETSFYWALVTL